MFNWDRTEVLRDLAQVRYQILTDRELRIYSPYFQLQSV